MKKLSRTQILLSIATLTLTSGAAASAQYAWFDHSTDIISVSGPTMLTNQCTIEAVFMLPSNNQSGGNLFDEWALGQEEKHLGLSQFSIDADLYPNDPISVSEPKGLITLDSWHHVALVYNGVEQRLYLDGTRIQSGPAMAPIANGSAQAFIGYAPRQGSDLPSFVGYLKSIRVSAVARYSGLTFTAPTNDLPADPDTLLLYNFEDPVGSTTVQDQSSLGRTGTLGTGFPGATAPQIIATLPAVVPLDLHIFTAIELQFSTTAGGQYQLQSSPDMAVWTPTPTTYTGDGTVMSKLISIHGSPHLFYRVVPMP